MKKIIMIISILLMLTILSACNRSNQNKENISNNTSPSPGPTTSLSGQKDAEEEPENVLRIDDYFPLVGDTEYVYTGEGNEFASYYRVTDFLDQEKKRIQTRSNNGGTETVRVLEIKDGKLSVIEMINECYYRENIMMNATVDNQAEVLLMEPLVEGTEWTLPDGRRRLITSTQTNIDTPYGNYKAIEVTTEDEDGVSKDYYAYQVGLVKSVFASEDLEVFSSLSKINTNVPYTQTIDIYYPNVDENIYVEQLELAFHTGDDTKAVLQEALSKKANNDTNLAIASINTKINSLYLGDDNIVYVDFSPELISDMNVGAGYEALILQCIVNTLGQYYGVQDVSITVEGKKYESGHILMKEGETLRVNMDKVIR